MRLFVSGSEASLQGKQLFRHLAGQTVCRIFVEELVRSVLNKRRRLSSVDVSEHAHNTGHKPLWNKVKFIDRDPYYYTRRVKEAIHIRLHPNNINRDSGIGIPEAWDAHDQKTQQQESCTTADRRGSKSLKVQQGSKCTNQSC